MYEVYLITNNINGKFYVGVTCRGHQERFKEHILDAMNGSSTALHQAIRKYGPSQFSICVLESDVPDNLVDEREMYYIKQYNTFSSNSGYNMTEGGGGMVGYKHTDEAKAKISAKLLGHKFPESRNQKIKQAMTGREYKPEWSAALSAARVGKFTKEDNSFYGKHHTDKTKSMISDANTKHRVLQLDKITREVIHLFKNTGEAGKWVVENGYSTAKPTTCEGRIGEVCRNGNNLSTAYGFGWKFDERSID